MGNGSDAARESQVKAIVASGRTEIDTYMVNGIMAMQDCMAQLQEKGCDFGRNQTARLDKLEAARKPDTTIRPAPEAQQGMSISVLGGKLFQWSNIPYNKTGLVTRWVVLGSVVLLFGWLIVEQHVSRKTIRQHAEVLSRGAVSVNR